MQCAVTSLVGSDFEWACFLKRRSGNCLTLSFNVNVTIRKRGDGPGDASWGDESDSAVTCCRQ